MADYTPGMLKQQKKTNSTTQSSYTRAHPFTYNAARRWPCRAPVIEHISRRTVNKVGLDACTHLPLLLADPQLVERAQASEDATAEPPAVPPFSRVARGMDLNL